MAESMLRYGEKVQQLVDQGYSREQALAEVDLEEVRRGSETADTSRLYEQDFVKRLSENLGASVAEARALLEWMVEEDAWEGISHHDDWEDNVLDWCSLKMERTRRYVEASGGALSGTGARKAAPEQKPRRPGQIVEEPKVSEKTVELAKLTSTFFAHRANDRSVTATFRREALGGTLLSPSLSDQELLNSLPTRHARQEAVEVAATLTEDYGWSPKDARRFLLTGELPEASPPLQLRIIGRSSELVAVQITVSLEVESKNVETAYAAAQRKMLDGDNQGVGAKALELYRFVAVEEARGADRSQSSRQALWRRWNCIQSREGKHRYLYPGVRELNRDLKRVEKIARKRVEEVAQKYTKDTPAE